MLVSGFRLRASKDFSIPSSRFGQRGITPAFGYGAPHPSAGGTSTLLIWALPSAHYGPIRPSPLLRYSRLAVLPLVLLPWHQPTGSCSSAQKPASESRPLYAGRRLPGHQASDRLVPEVDNASGFDDAKLLNDASSMGSLSFVSRTLTCSRSSLSFCSNAHHHGSLPQQLGVV